GSPGKQQSDEEGSDRGLEEVDEGAAGRVGDQGTGGEQDETQHEQGGQPFPFGQSAADGHAGPRRSPDQRPAKPTQREYCVENHRGAQCSFDDGRNSVAGGGTKPPPEQGVVGA